MSHFTKAWMCALALTVLPTLGLAQTGDTISQDLDLAERQVAEAENALAEMTTSIGQAVTYADQLERAVNSARNLNGLAIRVFQAIQNAQRLQEHLVGFERGAFEIRFFVEDIQRRAADADSATKVRAEGLMERVNQMDRNFANAESAVRGLVFKLQGLRAKLGNFAGFGTGN